MQMGLQQSRVKEAPFGILHQDNTLRVGVPRLALEASWLSLGLVVHISWRSRNKLEQRRSNLTD